MRMTAKIGVAAISLAAAYSSAEAGPKASPELNAAASVCFGKTHGTWPQMVEACTKLLGANVNPSVKAGAYYNRGTASMRLGAGGNALADFNEAIKINPTFARALNARASIYITQGKYDLAIADLNKSIAADPKSSAAYSDRGLAHSGKRDYKNALADLTKAIELEPGDPASYAVRGSIYLESGDRTRALADLDKAIAMDSKQVAAHFNRGIAHMKNGDKEKAKADFEAVLAIVPDHDEAKRRLSELNKAGG